MANELKHRHSTTGSNLYAVVTRASDGDVWNGSTFEDLLAANWGTYDIALTEQSTTQFYYGDMPAVSAGLYDLWVFERLGGSPATTDPLVGKGVIDWRGSAEWTLNNLPTTAQINTEVDTALADVGLTTTVTGRVDVAVSTRLAASSYTAPLDAAGTRTAIGMASANLDLQLSTIDDFLDTEVAAIKAKTDNLPSDPADASDIAASFSSIATTLSTIAGYIDTEVTSILQAVDTEVTAIKAKTDSLTFTVAGQVDANIQYVNDIQVTGTGETGNEWGPV